MVRAVTQKVKDALNSGFETQPHNLQLLPAGWVCRPPACNCWGSSNCWSTLLMLPADDFSNITGVANVLQKPTFTLVIHALSTKIYKTDSDLSETTTKVKVL